MFVIKTSVFIAVHILTDVQGNKNQVFQIMCGAVNYRRAPIRYVDYIVYSFAGINVSKTEFYTKIF